MSRCCHDENLRSIDDALQQIFSLAHRLTGSEKVATSQALGRVLAEPVSSQVNVPPWANSAMDGYCLRLGDWSHGQVLPISQRIPAGVWPDPLEKGTAARIFTGAPLPGWADTVVMQEDCVEIDGKLCLRDVQVVRGQHIRAAGQDIRAGTTVLPAGTRLGPAHLGVIASVGHAEVRVVLPLKVAIISTGDELVMPGTPLPKGKIYNSNGSTLEGLLTALGCKTHNYGIIADTPEATATTLLKAADECDVIIATGGVSVGEEDHIKTQVEALGQLHTWKLAIKPGKPFALGEVKNVPFLGLPGNPSAVIVTFSLLARPFLLLCMGVTEVTPLRLPIRSGLAAAKPRKRTEFLRVSVIPGADGQPEAVLAGNQSSGVLSSACHTSGLLVIPAGHIRQPGDILDFIPLSSVFN